MTSANSQGLSSSLEDSSLSVSKLCVKVLQRQNAEGKLFETLFEN